MSGAALIAAVLLVIWWRQQTFRWPIMLMVGVPIAPLISWWSGRIFVVPDYRAGCDGLCAGFAGAPVAFLTGETAGAAFQPGRFLLNSLLYLVLLMGWGAVVRAIAVQRSYQPGQRPWSSPLLAVALILLPAAFGPLVVGPPEAQVRGDSLRVAINARRETYLYDGLARTPILQTGLDDVRPRPDGKPGLRVCLRAYTVFYLPVGYLYLDMTPEGVHSNAGGLLPTTGSCWE
jgi:hypothetical protein